MNSGCIFFCRCRCWKHTNKQKPDRRLTLCVLEAGCVISLCAKCQPSPGYSLHCHLKRVYLKPQVRIASCILYDLYRSIWHVVKLQALTVTHRLSIRLMLILMNSVALETLVVWELKYPPERVVRLSCDQGVTSRGRESERERERVPQRVPLCLELSCPPQLANAGSGGGAWEITRKWAMGIRLR